MGVVLQAPRGNDAVVYMSNRKGMQFIFMSGEVEWMVLSFGATRFGRLSHV